MGEPREPPVPDTTPEPGPEPIPPPPPETDIVMEATDASVRITLPRLYGRADVVTTVLTAAIAVWLAVWLDAMRDDPTTSALGVGVMAVVALAFAVVAGSQGFEIAARTVIEAGDDALVCSRLLGARKLFRRTIPKAAITDIDRGRAIGEGPGSPPAVRIWTADDVHRVGRHLDGEAQEWLAGAVRQLAGLDEVDESD